MYQKKYLLFGSSKLAERISKFIDIDIDYIIDNDASKHNTVVKIGNKEFSVFSPEVLNSENLNNIEILLASSYDKEITKQLSEFMDKKGACLFFKHIYFLDNNYITNRVKIFLFKKKNEKTFLISHDFTSNEKLVSWNFYNSNCNVRLMENLLPNTLLKTNGEWVDDENIEFNCQNPSFFIEDTSKKSFVMKFEVEDTVTINNINFYKKYVNNLIEFSISDQEKNTDFIAYNEDVQVELTDADVKPIAIYLPQFHEIPENNLWWEKGFTEWTNVTKTYPFFENQYQPHQPIDVSYYDLNNRKTFKRQVSLAKKYGIHGFCYYYYNFQGKTLLEMPIDSHFNDKDIDMPYCIFWVNADWTNVWNGNHKEILLGQKYNDENDLKIIKDISKYMKDKRYIKVDGKPLLILHSKDKLPDTLKTSKIWRDYCREIGIGEIKILYRKEQNVEDPKSFGFDGLMEFSSLYYNELKYIDHEIKSYIPDFNGEIVDYEDLVLNKRHFYKNQKYNRDIYKTVVANWDNSARYKKDALVFHKYSPSLLKKWIMDAIEYTKKYHTTNDKYIFINAWNEWAEGAHLEPDRRYGYAHLNAVAEAILETRE